MSGLVSLFFPVPAYGQVAGSGSIQGTVVDPSGAAVPGAIVTIHDPVSGYEQSAQTGSQGQFGFPNVPFNPYHMTITAKGFAPYAQDVDVRSGVPVSVEARLALAGKTTSVTVESAPNPIENTPTTHTDISRQLFNKVPLESQSSSISSLVTGAVPFAADAATPVDLIGLTADQQLEAGLFCGSQFPTFSSALTSCAPSQYGSTLITIPAPGTENDDHNPSWVAPRNLFDVSLGDDNIFHGDKYKWSARLTVVNLTNKLALYNFLSTFSGTHYVTPRTITAQIGFRF